MTSLSSYSISLEQHKEHIFVVDDVLSNEAKLLLILNIQKQSKQDQLFKSLLNNILPDLQSIQVIFFCFLGIILVICPQSKHSFFNSVFKTL